MLRNVEVEGTAVRKMYSPKNVREKGVGNLCPKKQCNFSYFLMNFASMHSVVLLGLHFMLLSGRNCLKWYLRSQD